jgi:hypothetical protein
MVRGRVGDGVTQYKGHQSPTRAGIPGVKDSGMDLFSIFGGNSLSFRGLVSFSIMILILGTCAATLSAYNRGQEKARKERLELQSTTSTQTKSFIPPSDQDLSTLAGVFPKNLPSDIHDVQIAPPSDVVDALNIYCECDPQSLKTILQSHFFRIEKDYTRYFSFESTPFKSLYHKKAITFPTIYSRTDTTDFYLFYTDSQYSFLYICHIPNFPK